MAEERPKKHWLLKGILIAVMLIVLSQIVPVILFTVFMIICCPPSKDLMGQYPSPDNTYVVSTYLGNGGATTDFWVNGYVKNNDTGKERKLYHNYHCHESNVVWIDDDTISINDVVLDVEADSYSKGVYDYCSP